MIRPLQTSFLHFFAKVLALCAFLLSMNVAFAAPLTEASVRDLIGAMDKAVRSRDAQALGQLLSQGFRVHAEITAGSDRQVMNFTKSQYLGMLKDSWEGITGYTYERRDVRIRLLPDGASAEVSATVHETATAQGASVRMLSAQTATVRLIDGRLLLTRVVARTRSE